MRTFLSLLVLCLFLDACTIDPHDVLDGVDPNPAANPDGPPYPIVLAHGMFGAKDYLDILEYWSTIPSLLEAEGHQVFITEVDPLNTPEVRGERLIEQLEEIIAWSGSPKVILIGHSQGGLDLRYVSSTRPDLVAAAISMASPHGGTPAVEIALALLEDGGTIEDVVRFLENTFGPMLYSEVTDATDVYLSLHSMTPEAVAEFAAAYPDSPEVDIYSITGVTGRIPMDHPHCTPDLEVPFVQRWAGERDPDSFPLGLAEGLIDDDDVNDLIHNTYPNDGLVRAIDTHWGTFLGCIPADHAEELGIVNGVFPNYHPGCFGLCDGTQVDSATCDCNDFDYELFWVELAEWLRAQGY